MRNILSWFGRILILIFGLWSFVTLALIPLVNWTKVSSWESHAVTLESAEIVKTGPHSRDRKLRVSYHYRWRGVDYHGDKISIYHPAVAMPRKLQHSLQVEFNLQGEAQSLRAFVNPEKPTESILRRSFFPGWYGLAIFRLLLTWYFLYGAYWLLRLTASTKQQVVDSDSGTIAGQKPESEAWKFIGYFAGFFSLLGAGLVKMVIDHVRNGDSAALFFLIFPLASLLLWWLTWYAWSNRFDTSCQTDAQEPNITQNS